MNSDEIEMRAILKKLLNRHFEKCNDCCYTKHNQHFLDVAIDKISALYVSRKEILEAIDEWRNIEFSDSMMVDQKIGKLKAKIGEIK